MYAGFSKRFFAFLIDKIVISIIVLVIAWVLKIPQEQALVYSGINPYRLYYDIVDLNYFYVFLFIVLFPWLYFSLFEISDKKATPGKILLGIEVVNLVGNKITFWQATLRYFGKYVSGFIIGIGYLMVAFTKRKQALHDIIAKTLVNVKNNKNSS